MPHRVRLTDARRRLLRAVQRIDGPVFTTAEASEAWDMPREGTRSILEAMERVGLTDCKESNSELVWWLTPLARYDLECAAQA